MATKVIILNEQSFTSSINDTPLPYRQIRKMIFGLSALQNGSTAPTQEELLAELSEIQVSHSENVFDGLSFDGVDLLALNLMLLGHVPEFVTPAGDNQAMVIAPLYLPLNLNAHVTPSYHLLFSDNTKIDTEKITLGLELGVGTPAYKYKKKNDTADTVGTEIDMSVKGKRLRALMMYATTIPSTSNHQRSIKELKIIVNKVEQYHYNWYELGKGLAPVNAVENTQLGAILDNYRILIFGNPLPADDLTVWSKSDTATDTIEYIGVYV